MNFRPLNNHSRTPRSTKIFILFILVTFLILGANAISKGSLSETVRTQASVLLRIKTAIDNGTSFLNVLVSNKETLIQENNALRRQLTTVELYALTNKALVMENRSLRNLRTTVKDGETADTIIEHIISSVGLFPSGTLLISRDKGNKYTIGSYVVQRQNIVLGTVTEVHTHTAVVQLTSSPGAETDVIIGEAERKVRATVKGTGNGNMVATIDRSVDIRIDDPVVLYNNGGMLVGYVGAIDKKPIDALQKVYIRTPLNISTIQFVIVKQII